MDDHVLGNMINKTMSSSLLSKTITESSSFVDQVKGQLKGDNLKINARIAARGIFSALGPVGRILAAGSESGIDTLTQERLMTINDLREIILSICNYLFDIREIERNLNGKTVDILPRGISITKLANDIRENNSGLENPLLMDTLTFYGNNQGDESAIKAELSRSTIAKYISTDWGKLLTNDEYIIPDGYPSDLHTKKNKKLEEGGKYLSSVDISPGDTVTILGKYLDTTDTEKKWWHINKSESNTAGTFVLNVKLKSGMMGLLCDHNNSITDEEFKNITVLSEPRINTFHGIMTPQSALRASQEEGERLLQKIVERKAEEEKAAAAAAAELEAAAAAEAEAAEAAAEVEAAAAAEAEAAEAAEEEEKAAAAERRKIMGRKKKEEETKKRLKDDIEETKKRLREKYKRLYPGMDGNAIEKKITALMNKRGGNIHRRKTQRRKTQRRKTQRRKTQNKKTQNKKTQNKKTQNKKTKRRKTQRRKRQRKNKIYL